MSQEHTGLQSVCASPYLQVIAFRFDTSELESTWTEICAYGTAVRARQL
jgi:putative heavy-metal-binding protein